MDETIAIVRVQIRVVFPNPTHDLHHKMVVLTLAVKVHVANIPNVELATPPTNQLSWRDEIPRNALAVDFDRVHFIFSGNKTVNKNRTKKMKKSNTTNQFWIIVAIAAILLTVIVVFIAIYPSVFQQELSSDIDDEHLSLRDNASAKDLVNDTLPISAFFDNDTSPCVDFYGYACGNFHAPQNLGFGSLAAEIADANQYSIISALPDRSHPVTHFFTQCTDALLGNQQVVSDGLVMAKLRNTVDTELPSALAELHAVGFMPFVTFIRDDDLLRWNRSVWTREVPRLTKAGCGYLAANGFVRNRGECEVNMHLMYQQLEQIFASGAHAEDLTASQMETQFPLLYTQSFAGKHRLWSPIQMLSLNLLIKNGAFVRTFLQLVIVLDAAGYVPSVWSGDEHYLSYASLASAPGVRHARDFFYFRNGLGPFGLDAARRHHSAPGKGEILDSCLFLTEQMLPHLNQELVIPAADRASAQALADDAKVFLKNMVAKSKQIFPIMKRFLTEHIDETQVVLGFPGESPKIAWSSLSFLEMVWEIRRFQVARQMTTLWPPSMLSGSCDSEIMLRDHTIFVPMCLYRNSWFRELLPFVLFHEWAHMLDPRAIEELGAPRDAIVVMKATVTKMGNPTLEHFADIVGLRLAYEFCKARGACADVKGTRAFLIKNAQMWCNGNQAQPTDANYGTDKDRMRNAFYFLLDTNNVHPLSVAYKCSKNALFFETVVPFF